MITCLTAALSLSVGTVVLSVLKWILLIVMWIVIGVVGLALVLLAILLFCPLGYHADASKEGKDIQAQAKAAWLFHLLRAKVSYKDKKLVWSVKLGPKQLAGSEAAEKKKPRKKKEERFFKHGSLEEEDLDNREEKAEQKDQPGSYLQPDQAAEPEPLQPEIRSEQEVLPRTEPEPEPELHSHVEAVPGKENPLQAARRIVANAQKNLEQKAADRKKRSEKRQEERLLKEKKTKERKGTRKEAPKAGPKKDRKTLADLADKVLDLSDRGLDLALDFIDRLLDAPDTIEDFIAEKTKPIRPYLDAWQSFPDKEATGRDLMTLVRRILKALFFKHIQADAVFGTGDPYWTGRILGYYDFLSPLLFPKQTRRDYISLEGDFESKVIDFTLTGNGHFCLWTLLVWPALRALASKRVRLLIKTVKGLVKQKKQSTNQKETDDVTSQHE